MKIRSKSFEMPDEGTHMARLVGLVDLGHQPGFNEDDKSKYQIEFTYELVSSEMKDGRPFHVSERVTNSDSDMGTLVTRCKALRASMGDLKAALGSPCMVTLKLNQKKTRVVVDGKGGVSGVPMGMPVNELRNPVTYFDPYDPDLDLEVFASFPEWKQDLLKNALDFDDMALKTALQQQEGKF